MRVHLRMATGTGPGQPGIRRGDRQHRALRGLLAYVPKTVGSVALLLVSAALLLVAVALLALLAVVLLALLAVVLTALLLGAVALLTLLLAAVVLATLPPEVGLLLGRVATRLVAVEPRLLLGVDVLLIPAAFQLLRVDAELVEQPGMLLGVDGTSLSLLPARLPPVCARPARHTCGIATRPRGRTRQQVARCAGTRPEAPTAGSAVRSPAGRPGPRRPSRGGSASTSAT